MNPASIIVALYLLYPFAVGVAQADSLDSGPVEAVDAYERDARSLVGAIEADAAPSEVDSRARVLMSMSRDILADFSILYPPCGPYFDAVFGLSDRLDAISKDDLERDYHADGRLPNAPTFCYHAKDFFVHPASVVVLVRIEGSRAQMASEMHEALAHVAVVRSLMASPADTPTH